MDRKQFAMENIGLLYHYYEQYKISDEDLRQDLALAYWRAIRTYKMDSEVFLSSYVYRVLNMELSRYINYHKAEKRTLFTGVSKYSLDAQASDDAKETFGAIIGHTDKNIAQIECDDVIERFMDCLPANQANIMRLAYQGYSCAMIARALGTTRQNVNTILHRAQKKARTLLWKEMME